MLPPIHFAVTFLTLCLFPISASFGQVRISLLSPTLQDRRIAVSRDQIGEFTPIGIVHNSNNNGVVTATLIDECHVLTAAHIIRNTTDAELQATNPTLTFHVGPSSIDRPFAKIIPAKLILRGRYVSSAQNSHSDWMLLKLPNDQCVGREYGFMQLDMASFEEISKHPGKLLLAGFPRDRSHARHITVDPSCSTVGGGGIYWMHDCRVVRGNSGGGMLRRDLSGNLRISMIQSTAIVSETPVVYNLETANHAAPSHYIWEKIQPYFLEMATQDTGSDR